MTIADALAEIKRVRNQPDVTEQEYMRAVFLALCVDRAVKDLREKQVK